MSLNTKLKSASHLLVIATILMTGAVHADTYTFIGGGTTDNWSDSTNWSGGVAPTNDGTADIILSSSTSTSNIDTTWEVNSITQASGAAYTLTSSSGTSLQVNSSFDNASTGTLTLAATIANTDTSSGYFGLNFNSGTFRITGSAMTYVNVNVAPAANLLTSSSATVTSVYGAIGVGQSGGIVGGSGTFTTASGSDFLVRGPDAGGLGPTLVVGDPSVNGAVGTLSIASPGVSISNSSLNFAFGGGNHSLLTTTGDLSLAGTLAFNISNVDSTTAAGDYTLVSYTGAAIDSGILAGAELNLPTGWEGSLQSSSGLLTLDLTQTDTAVPEPQLWAMMGLGLFGLVLLGFRKNARQASLVSLE